MTTADPSTAIAPSPGDGRRPGRDSLDANRRKEVRTAYLLLAPTIVVMAVVVGYPIVLSVINSFQQDSHIDPTTGFAVTGGFAGLSNYTHWLFQQCNGVTAAPSPARRASWPPASGPRSSTRSSSRS